MPANSLDCVFFIQQPPSVELREGMFHISFGIGRDATFELVMSPNTFIKMRKVSAETLEEFEQGRSGTVVPMRRRKH